MSANATTNHSRSVKGVAPSTKEINISQYHDNDNKPDIALVNDKQPVVSKFPCTTDYGMFKMMIHNRPVHKGHVEQLKYSIQKVNLLHIRPIQVDHEFNVYDGQHRLMAAQALNVPIYYEISKDLNDEGIIILNNYQKSWSFYDYMNFYASKGYPEYIRLSKMVDETKMFITTYMGSFSIGAGDDITGNFRTGKLKLKDQEIIDETMDKYNLVMNVIKQKIALNERRYISTRNFQTALLKFVQLEEIDFDIFLKKINSRISFLHQCPTKTHYYKMFEDIYNFRNSTPLNIYNNP